MSQAHFMLGDYEAAREEIERSYLAYENAGLILGQANALAESGWQLMLMGRYEEGLVETDRALEMVPESVETVYYKVNILIYRRCVDGLWEVLADELEAIAKRTNDQLLAQSIEKALEHPCER